MVSQSQKPEVHHNQANSRFELIADGKQAVLDYTLNKDTITFTHTEVPAVLEGRGIGSQLARIGLDYAREKGLSVVPLCSFVAGYIQKHAEYQDLLKK